MIVNLTLSRRELKVLTRNRCSSGDHSIGCGLGARHGVENFAGLADTSGPREAPRVQLPVAYALCSLRRG